MFIGRSHRGRHEILKMATLCSPPEQSPVGLGEWRVREYFRATVCEHQWGATYLR